MEKLMTPKKFSLAVEQVVQECGCSHMEAVLEYCKEHQLEPESVARLVSKGLKDKIEANARDLNYFSKRAKLPI